MEYFDIYNADRSKTGRRIERGKKFPEGGYRLIVHICIFNGRGEMLIQRRQPFKKGWSGKWDVSCGGSVVFGETSSEGAEREVFEELGLKTDLKNKLPHLTLNGAYTFDDYYIIKQDVDLSFLTLQESEVAEVKWANQQEILEKISEGSFIPYREGLVKLLFELNKKRGAHIYEDNEKA